MRPQSFQTGDPVRRIGGRKRYVVLLATRGNKVTCVPYGKSDAKPVRISVAFLKRLDVTRP